MIRFVYVFICCSIYVHLSLSLALSVVSAILTSGMPTISRVRGNKPTFAYKI